MSSVPFDPHPFEQAFEQRRRVVHGIRIECDAVAFVQQLAAQGSDQEYLRGYCQACPVEGARPEDYAPRIVQLNRERRAIAQIHFRGLSLEYPFIDIFACDGALPENIDLEYLASQFSRFHPRAVRFWTAGREPPPYGGLEDLLVLASPISPLLHFPPPPHFERIQIEPDPALDSFDDYRALYAELRASSPELVRPVSAEDRATLAACAQVGGFCRVMIDGRAAGYIAARAGSYRCWKGWEMIDEILAAEFRGKGLAPAMQFTFLRALDLQRASSIFGTISSRNLPSIMTARRVGREVVETGYFVSLKSEQSEQ